MRMDIYEWLHRWDLVYQGELLLRIVIACILGCLIGYERTSRDKSAGMRTHAIVAMGAALMMVVSKYGFRDIPDYDASRVAAQIVSGVGFLGAGVIFVKNNTVSGLTTAAGIWATAGVGMAIGGGVYFIGVCGAIFVVLTQVALHKIRRLAAEPYHGYLKVTTQEFELIMDLFQNYFEKEKIKILGIKVNKAKNSTKLEFDLLYPARYEKNKMIMFWSRDKRIDSISG